MVETVERASTVFTSTAKIDRGWQCTGDVWPVKSIQWKYEQSNVYSVVAYSVSERRR